MGVADGFSIIMDDFCQKSKREFNGIFMYEKHLLCEYFTAKELRKDYRQFFKISA